MEIGASTYAEIALVVSPESSLQYEM
jgi:hypothetical protein